MNLVLLLEIMFIMILLKRNILLNKKNVMKNIILKNNVNYNYF